METLLAPVATCFLARFDDLAVLADRESTGACASAVLSVLPHANLTETLCRRFGDFRIASILFSGWFVCRCSRLDADANRSSREHRRQD